jgi:cytochrome P450
LGDLTAWFDRSKLLPVSWLHHHIMDVIEVRTQEGKSASSKKDYLQILLDAQGDSKELKDEFDKSVNYNDVHLNKKLTLNEINANLVLFLLAGYETTSNTLSSCLYTLSKYPEEQNKLIDEFNEYFTTIPENPTYEEINSLPYFDMFVKEVLRLYPIIPLNRRCVNKTTALGIEFDEGISMDVDILSVHHDPELWGPVDTNEFYALRHAPEEKRNPLALCTFGLGIILS